MHKNLLRTNQNLLVANCAMIVCAFCFQLRLDKLGAITGLRTTHAYIYYAVVTVATTCVL